MTGTGPCPPEVGTVVDPDNRSSPNHGCATRANLAAMVANPADLNAPRPGTPADGARTARVIDAYRQGQNTSAQYSTGAAAVSRVAGATR